MPCDLPCQQPPHELVEAMKDIPVRPVLVEEFLTGAEHLMEAYTLNGVPLFASFSRYYPSPLEVMQNPWIQWGGPLSQRN